MSAPEHNIVYEELAVSEGHNVGDVAMTPGIVVTTTIPFLFYYFL